MNSLKLTTTQMLANGFLAVVVTAIVFGGMLVAVNMGLSTEALGLVIFIGFGFAIGYTFGVAVKRGWTYYNEKASNSRVYGLTKAIRIGSIWRVLVIWFGGRFISAALISQCSSETGEAVMLLLSIATMTAAAMYFGMRFGWEQAGKSDPSPLLATHV